MKDGAERRGILLRWILQQLPLIELELNPVHSVEKTSIEADVGVRQRPKRDRTDDLDPEQVSKRQKKGGQRRIRSLDKKPLRPPTRPRRKCIRSCLRPLRRSTRMTTAPDRFQ